MKLCVGCVMPQQHASVSLSLFLSLSLSLSLSLVLLNLKNAARTKAHDVQARQNMAEHSIPAGNCSPVVLFVFIFCLNMHV